MEDECTAFDFSELQPRSDYGSRGCPVIVDKQSRKVTLVPVPVWASMSTCPARIPMRACSPGRDDLAILEARVDVAFLMDVESAKSGQYAIVREVGKARGQAKAFRSVL
jgi:hypothetical protein